MLVKVALVESSRAGKVFWPSGLQPLPSQEGLLPAVLSNVCLCGACSAHANFELYIFFQEILAL